MNQSEESVRTAHRWISFIENDLVKLASYYCHSWNVQYSLLGVLVTGRSSRGQTTYVAGRPLEMEWWFSVVLLLVLPERARVNGAVRSGCTAKLN